MIKQFCLFSFSLIILVAFFTSSDSDFTFKETDSSFSFLLLTVSFFTWLFSSISCVLFTASSFSFFFLILDVSPNFFSCAFCVAPSLFALLFEADPWKIIIYQTQEKDTHDNKITWLCTRLCSWGRSLGNCLWLCEFSTYLFWRGRTARTMEYIPNNFQRKILINDIKETTSNKFILITVHIYHFNEYYENPCLAI